MKTQFAHRRIRAGTLAARSLAAAIASLLASHAASAADLWWDRTPGTVGAGDGLTSGGSGTWDHALGNWTSDGGAHNIAWVNAHNDTAIFSDAAGTVTLTTGINVGGLTFNDVAYTLTGNTLTFGTAGAIITNVDAAIDAVIAGSDEISKLGVGTLTLSGANTYAGATAIWAGTLKLGAAGNASASPLGSVAGGTSVVVTGAALDLNGSSIIAAEPLFITGSGVDATGALTNSSTTAATYPGVVTLGSGGASIGGSGNITLAAGLAADAEALTKVGITCTLTLAAPSTRTGTVTISGGAVKVAADGALGAAATSVAVIQSGSSAGGDTNRASLDLNGVTYTTASPLAISGNAAALIAPLTNNSSTAATYGGVVTLAGASGIGTLNGNITLSAGLGADPHLLAKQGNKTLLLNAASNRSGPVTIYQGTLKVAASGAMGTGVSSNTVTVNAGGALDLNGVNYIAPSLLTLNGTGILSGGALTNSSAAAATYAGLLRLGSDASIIANNGDIIISNPGNITGPNLNLTLGGSATGCRLASIIDTVIFSYPRTGSMTKIGSGTWTLTGASTYTGMTTISAGTLAYGANNVLGPGAVTIGSGTLDIAGFTDTVGDVILASGSIVGTSGVLSIKSCAVIGPGSISAKLAGTGGLSKSGVGTLSVSVAHSYTGGTTVYGGGTILLNGASGSLSASSTLWLGLANDYTGAGTFIYDNAGASGPLSQTFAGLNVPNNVPSDNTLQLTRTAAHNVSLTFNVVGNNYNENGNTVNFVTKDFAGGGINGTHYKIALGNGLSALVGAGASSYYNIISQNAYFNGGDFAVYDPAGFVRGIKYGVDAGSATSAGGASFAVTNNQEITGHITAQPTLTLGTTRGIKGTLKIKGASNLTLANDAVLTFAAAGIGTGLDANSGASGIIKTGGGKSTISGAGVASLALNQVQGDIRVDGPSDVLEITTLLTLNGKVRFMKSGAGKLIFSGSHTYVLNGAATTGTGATTMYISGGVLEIGGTATLLPSTADNSQCQMLIGRDAAFNYNSSSTASLISTPIKGVGSVMVSGPGTLELSGLSQFTGQLTVAAGTLKVATVNSANADGPLGNSDLAVILGASGGSTGTLQFTGPTTTSTKNFTLAAGGTGAFQIDNAGTTLTLGGAISGAGSLRKAGYGPLSLAGATTYSGDTTVVAGTLSVSTAFFNDSSSVSIGTEAGASAVLNLNTGATDTVRKLFIDGERMPAGTYGSMASVADHRDNSAFAGTGILNVLTGPPTYDAWATTTHGLSGDDAAFDFDYDHDGIANGLEWILGGDPTANDSPAIRPVVGGSAASGLTLVFSRESDSISATTLAVEWGGDLAALTNSMTLGSSNVGPNGNNPTVAIDVPSVGQITVTIPAANAQDGKLFARLRASQP